MAEVNFWNEEGSYLGGTSLDEEPDREGLVEYGGYLYIWNQRNSQWRRVRGTYQVPKARATEETTASA